MTIREKLLKITKGRYHHMEWQSVTTVNGITYTKLSSGSVRFVDYYNLTGKEKPENYDDSIIKVAKNGKEYIQIFTTGKAPRVAYFKGEQKISKSDYEKEVKKSSNNIGIMFIKHLDDILVLD